MSFGESLDALARRLGGRVTALAHLSAGASFDTWSFDLARGSAAGGREPLILRRLPGEEVRDISITTPELEAQVIAAAADAGVAVPAVVHVLDREDGLGRGYLMRRIEGETLPPRILRNTAFAEARTALVGQLGRELAIIHAVPVSGLPLTRSTPAAELATLRRVGAQSAPVRPVFALALRWLLAHLPQERAATLVHGDFRLGNLIVGPEGLRSVIDWEVAHVGDPHEDLAWLCVNSWRFGNVDLPVAGLGQREELFAAYEAAGGLLVDPARVHFWEVLGTLRWGLMCADMTRWFRSSGEQTIERAMISRRSTETEIDILNLIAPRS